MYVALVALVVWAMIAARGSALADLGTAESRDNWQEWREDVQQQQDAPGPVARRVPKSAEPPGLVLMRDYFAVCLVGAIVFASLLYWVLAWFVTGVLRSPPAEVRSPLS
jgi:hypothetical protein